VFVTMKGQHLQSELSRGQCKVKRCACHNRNDHEMSLVARSWGFRRARDRSN
jgi:hypothetical protein